MKLSIFVNVFLNIQVQKQRKELSPHGVRRAKGEVREEK